MEFFIYGLFDFLAPDELRYIGITQQPAKRYATHRRGKDPCTGKWARKLKGRIGFIVLDMTSTKRTAEALERDRISRLKNLLNIRPVSLLNFKRS